MRNHSLPPEDLFGQFKEGRKDAFAQLFQLFHPGLVFIAALRLPDNPHVGEIANTSLFKAWKKRKSFRNLADLSIFLDEETKRACISHQDPVRPSRNPPKENRDPEFYANDADIDSPYVPLLEKAIGQMGPMPIATRRIFDLAFIEGMSYAEIAMKLNMTREAVAARIKRMLDSLGPIMDFGSYSL
jgi:RNA polymerase sigma factor (sigma-70 family)